MYLCLILDQASLLKRAIMAKVAVPASPALSWTHWLLSTPSFQLRHCWPPWKRDWRIHPKLIWSPSRGSHRFRWRSCRLWNPWGQSNRISGGYPDVGSLRLLLRSCSQYKVNTCVAEMANDTYKITLSSTRVDFLEVPPNIWHMFSIGILTFFDLITFYEGLLREGGSISCP